jgi:hypothetical protein
MLDDGAVHSRCLKNWRKLDHFVRLFNEALARTALPQRLMVSPDGEISWASEDRF